MGGLAHVFEDEGLATTQVSLVREHSVEIRPPRALWVPFDLGRPLGTPDDAAFQTRVLRAALALLAAPSGPVLEDFPDQAPDAAPAEGWACPIPLPPPTPPGDATEAALLAEIERLLPWHAVAQRDRQRSTARLSGRAPADCARLLAEVLREPEGAPSADELRFACTDLKAFYMEAATARPGQQRASARQVADWFWGETSAGQVLMALRAPLMESSDKAMRLFAGRLLVPLAQYHRLSQAGG
ncbi:MAG: hypothetical protein RIM84_18460 [Alphaproteobacteria bacterium]